MNTIHNKPQLFRRQISQTRPRTPRRTVGGDIRIYRFNSVPALPRIATRHPESSSKYPRTVTPEEGARAHTTPETPRPGDHPSKRGSTSTGSHAPRLEFRAAQNYAGNTKRIWLSCATAKHALHRFLDHIRYRNTTPSGADTEIGLPGTTGRASNKIMKSTYRRPQMWPSRLPQRVNQHQPLKKCRIGLKRFHLN